MTSLAAFSLVAGILQVLDVSFRTVKVCREIYKDGSAAAHRDTGELAEALGRSALSSIRRHSTRRCVNNPRASLAESSRFSDICCWLGVSRCRFAHAFTCCIIKVFFCTPNELFANLHSTCSTTRHVLGNFVSTIAKIKQHRLPKGLMRPGIIHLRIRYRKLWTY